MEQPKDTGAAAWGMISAAIGFLLLAIGVVGVVGIVANERVRSITEHAVEVDLEVEDEGDDLRAAVLELRHYHRNIFFGGPSEGARQDFAQAYDALLEEIDELERVNLAAYEVTQPAEIRRMAEAYDATFRAAIDLHASDREAFGRASDEGLRQLQEMQDAAEEIEGLGEQLATESLTRIEDENATERIVLIALVAGVVLVGVALAVAAARILARIRASYAREQAASQELARALRAKSDFIADASHELRTPLTVIRGNADIGVATPGEPLHREVLQEISTEAARMSRLVEDLLFLARSDFGAPPLEREYVPARWLVSRLGKPAEVLAQQRESCLTADLAAEGYLEVDPARVQQAVMILVDNAAKHSPPGACVALTTRTTSGELVIEVVDTGPGIPPDELLLIFDRFYQVGTRRTRKKGGTGLGLSIAKTIVEAHGGRIEVESRVNQGTTMTIRLPLCAAPQPEVTGPASAPASVAAGKPLAKLNGSAKDRSLPRRTRSSS